MSQPGNTEDGAGAPNDFTAAYGHATEGRLTEAEAICRSLLDADPKDADALQLLGGIAQQSGNADDAAELYQRAITARPGFAKAHSNLGTLLLGQGKTEEAERHFEKAIASDPGYGPAHNNLGNIYVQTDRYEDAQAAFEKAVATEPEDAIALNNLGTVLIHQDKFDAAIEYFEKALTFSPDLAMAPGNLGEAFKKKGDFVAAKESLHRAVELRPESAEYHTNLGAVYRLLGQLDAAQTCHEKALELKPNLQKARFHLSLILLVQGHFAEGWKDYLARPSTRSAAKTFHRDPFAEDLEGTDLFIRHDQGLGDEIFFLRFAHILKARGARITYSATAKIRPILARVPFLDEVVDDKAVPATGQLNLSVGDLPYVSSMKSEADIPPSLTFNPLTERLESIKARLAALGPAPYIGVTLRAGIRSDRTLYKAIDQKHLCPALARGLGDEFPGTVVALQRNPEVGEIESLSAALGRPVHDLTGLNDDLEDMLAALNLIDEYVTVSNTNVHLRAGVGRTSRVLVPNPPEWRWMGQGDDSPWFPGCPVYRQGADGNWDAALLRLAKDLRDDLG